MRKKTTTGLDRPLQEMPGFVEKALQEKSLIKDYEARPAYQQNDYLWWINSAKRQSTKEKRLNQMLDELKKGGVYMGMVHRPSTKS
jgi:uncharacterized protein YdeI (YjbR/CyaY-like superfamily)